MHSENYIVMVLRLGGKTILYMNKFIPWPLCRVALRVAFRGKVLHKAVYPPLLSCPWTPRPIGDSTEVGVIMESRFPLCENT